MCNTKITVLNLFANEVVIKCNMFHTRVKHRIRAEVGRIDIVVVDNRFLSKGETEFTK